MLKWIKKKLFAAKETPPSAPIIAKADVSDTDPEDNKQQTYSADQPIETQDQDRFSRWPFAKRIAETLVERGDPSSLVIGLYGPWGDGKTSTLRMMQKVLAGHERVVVVQFNPWHFGSEPQLLRGFFASLSEALGRSLSTWKESLGDVLSKYGSLLSLASVNVTPGISLSAGDAAKGLGEALSAVELDELRTRVERFLEEQKIRVVVLIDDIDRLDHVEIHATFKIVKLSASFRYTSYVLAFDDNVVAAALGRNYGEGGIQAGRRFLEKIVQVPLHLPAADSIELRTVAFQGVEAVLDQAGYALTEEQGEAFARHFVDGIEPQLRTPRQAKLYLNAITFALPLLKGETHPVDAMLVEGIRVFYPNLYGAIRDNGELFLRSRENYSGQREQAFRAELNTLIEKALEKDGAADIERVKDRLLEPMFPRTSGMGYGSDWNSTWASEQRICSNEYFARYFTYSVPRRDVSDAALARFINDIRADRLDVTTADAWLANVSERGAMESLLQKLRWKEDAIDPEGAGKLALLIARNGKMFPKHRSAFSFTQPFSQAGILSSQLLRRISPGAQREELARQIIGTAQPLPFAFECFRWVRHSDDREEAKRIVSPEIENAIGLSLADRIRAESAQTPAFVSHGEDASGLYWLWKKYRDKAEVEAHLRASLDADLNNVDRFLDGYVGRAWGMESGLSNRADFNRDAYNGLIDLIDPEFVLAKLHQRYGFLIGEGEFHRTRDLPIAERIANQFAWIHRFASNEAKNTAEAKSPDQAACAAPNDEAEFGTPED